MQGNWLENGFGFNDQNEGSKWFKIGGFILTIIGVIIIMLEF